MKKQIKLLFALVAAGAGIWTAFGFQSAPYYYTVTSGGYYYEYNASYKARSCGLSASDDYCVYSCPTFVGSYATSGELVLAGATGEFFNKIYIY